MWAVTPVALTDDKKALIRFEDGRSHATLPLNEHTGLFMEFAACKNPQNFASIHGVLYNTGEPEPLEAWERHIANMKWAVDRWQAGKDMNQVMTSIEHNLNVKPEFLREKQELELLPANLLAAMWLQFALAIHHKYQFRSCEWCKKPFHAKGKQIKAERVFCSKSCSMHEYRDRLAHTEK